MTHHGGAIHTQRETLFPSSHLLISPAPPNSHPVVPSVQLTQVLLYVSEGLTLGL